MRVYSARVRIRSGAGGVFYTILYAFYIKIVHIRRRRVRRTREIVFVCRRDGVAYQTSNAKFRIPVSSPSRLSVLFNASVSATFVTPVRRNRIICKFGVTLSVSPFRRRDVESCETLWKDETIRGRDDTFNA